MTSYPPLIDKIHNFGIYLKKGKRAIIQLDFPGKTFNIIQRGHIKKIFTFENLQHFDSAEDLHIVLKIREAEIEFQADNSEEKYTICRLLSLIIDSPYPEYETLSERQREKVGGICVLPPVSLRQETVLKDGLLEKKGNTTITTWNRRRVKISAGEFSYYKPGDELALNIVQIWDGACQIKRSGTNGFNVIIRDSRTYSFRCSCDSKSRITAEADRDDWITAFEKAMLTRRHTLVYIDDSLLSNQNKQDVSPRTADITSPQKFSTGVNDNQYQPRTPEITAHLSVSVSYVSEQSQDQNKNVSLSTTPIYSISQPDLSTNVPIHVPVPGMVIPKLSPSSPENIYSLQTTILTRTSMEDRAPTPPPPLAIPHPTRNDSNINQEFDDTSVTNARAIFEEKIKLLSSDFDGTDNKDIKRRKSIEQPSSPVRQAPQSPALTPGPPPPPPPLLNVKRAGVKLSTQPSTKLKQAHWNKISNSAADQSIWNNMHDVTKNLNVIQLEEQFCLKEKDGKRNSKELQESQIGTKKTLLLDQKRAHVLGIIVNGMKIAGNINMVDVLSTITETETFPSETLSTIRSCQPTAEDIEMYKVFRGSRDDLMPVDRFMMELCEVPKIGLRLELVQIIWEFPKTYEAVQEEVDDIWLACDEVVSCTKLIKVLEYVLAIGNFLNSKWSSGYGVRGFEITSIDKVLQVKGRSNNNVLEYLVNTLRKNDAGLLTWMTSLKHIPTSAEYSVKAIGAEIEVLKNDIVKVNKHMRVLKHVMTAKPDKKFQAEVQVFMNSYEKKIDQLDAKAHQLSCKYHRTLEYFGEKPDRPSDVFFTSLNQFMENFQQTVGKPL